MEDRGIVDLFFARSEEALRAVETRYGAYCRAIARNLLEAREDAEECLNDVWHAAWNAIPPERPEDLRAYLGRLTRNLCVSRWRREHARKRYGGMDLLLSELEESLPGGTEAEAELERARLRETIDRWLGSLSREDRVLFVRRYWYGAAVKDLAAEWEMGENRMAQRLRRLRRSLRGALERGGLWE